MTRVVKDWQGFSLVAPPLSGAVPLKGLRRGQPVSAGELLARHPDPGAGDIHAPAAGWIQEINEREVIIQSDDQAVGQPPEPRPLADLSGPALARALKELGVNLPEALPGDPLIVNTVDPEPGIGAAPALFGEHRETVSAGLEAAARLWPGRPVAWAVTDPGRAPAEAERVVPVNGAYPATVPALVKKAVTGRNDPEAAGVLDGRELYVLGRVWRTGRPVTRMALTLGDSTYFVPVGARVIDLLTFANMVPGPGDLVVAGGLIRGAALGRLERGLGQSVAALHMIRGGVRAEAVAPCRVCRECARACPAGLAVDEAARPDPADWPARADRLRSLLAGCLRCGACALACPARRPLLSLVRLAAKRL